MDTSLPLPGTTSELVARVPFPGRHPGLQLDKFIGPAVGRSNRNNRWPRSARRPATANS